ncbi:MAG: ABC transporter substrate-binding protein, partial [Actinomycetota bacterium]
QIAGSYDTHLIKLAEFLGKEVKKDPCPAVGECAPNQSIYSGKKRIAAVELDSKYIRGSVASFEAAVKANGLEWAGAVLVPKYTDSSNTHIYTGQCLELSQMGAQIVVPATDPLTTSNMTVTGECSNFLWSMSNFAHDSDVALKLMGGTWYPPKSGPGGFKGLAGGCYYQLWSDPDQASKCGKLKEAHDAWVAVAGESDWNENGQGGLAGYQITHIWLGALTNAGPDLTREKFVAALNAYNNYDDLVTVPITYLNSPNIAHGIDRFAVYEATSSGGGRWKQISDGLVGSF